MSKLTLTERHDLAYNLNKALMAEPQTPRVVVIHSNWGADDVAVGAIVFNEVEDVRRDHRIYFGAMLCVAGHPPVQTRPGAGRIEIVEQFVLLCCSVPDRVNGFGNPLDALRISGRPLYSIIIGR